MTVLELWTKFFTLIKSITGDVDVAGKGTLQEQIDDCFTSASNGKKAIAAAITGKGVSTAADATYDTMAGNISKIKTTPTLQAKSAALSTSAQTIKPDSGYDGLSQVSVPAVTGNAGTGDVLSGKTFNSASAGIAKTGTLADKTGTADYSATASLDATNKRIKMQVPAGGKYGTGNYLYAAYSAIASLIGLTAAKLVKGNTILGITGNSNNMDTSGGDATAAQILSGKKACIKGSLITGTLADKTGTADYSATASLDATNKRIKMQVPAGGKYGTGNYLYAAYSAIASLIGLTAAKLVKGNTILGITGNSNNMDTSGGDATAAQILSGKKACVKGSLITGTMANKSGVTIDAGAVTQNDDYTYLDIPAAGYYNTSSKLRALNSDLSNTLESLWYTSGTSGATMNVTTTFTSTKKGKILLILTIGSISENFRGTSSASGHNTCSCNVSSTSGSKACLQDQYMQPLISSSGADNENWAERNFLFLFSSIANEEITVSLYAHTNSAGHVWTGKAYYI